MDGKSVDELHKAFLVARLNLEKSERTAGHLGRFLAHRAITRRLLVIAFEQRMIEAPRTAGSGAHGASVRADMEPVPSEVREALREVREWRDAARRAYARIPEREREKLALPAMMRFGGQSRAVAGVA
jgi:hypothetical protein